MPDEPTEVLSLDELMDLASEPSTAKTMPIRRVQVTSTPAPLNPAAPKPAAHPAVRPAPQHRVATPRHPKVLDQSREKLFAISDIALQWLRDGDNGLIAATAAVALLLLVIVAAI